MRRGISLLARPPFCAARLKRGRQLQKTTELSLPLTAKTTPARPAQIGASAKRRAGHLARLQNERFFRGRGTAAKALSPYPIQEAAEGLFRQNAKRQGAHAPCLNFCFQARFNYPLCRRLFLGLVDRLRRVNPDVLVLPFVEVEVFRLVLPALERQRHFFRLERVGDRVGKALEDKPLVCGW